MKSIKDLIDPFAASFKEPEQGTIDKNLPILQLQVAVIYSLKSQMIYYLSGTQRELQYLADRSFMHLQQCIIADEEYKKKWESAFKKGETKCEALGAIHLLWHGIWAFKANTTGGRTDLVLGNIIDNGTKAIQTALGLVLTEWKLVRRESEIVR